MAKKKSSKKKSPSKQKSVRGFGGGTLSVQMGDLLYVVGGAALNYLVINPAINKLTEKMKKKDGTPMLGEHQGKILTIAKGGGAGYAAYAIKKLPKEARLALVGVAAASGIELAGQVMPDKMVALNGTGDLFLNVGSTQFLEIPMNNRLGAAGDRVAVFGAEDAEGVAVFGTGDLFSGGL